VRESWKEHGHGEEHGLVETMSDISDLDLEQTAEHAAEMLKEAYPEVVFTSGRRSVYEQARAMASNIVSSGDRKWIQKVYASSPPIRKL
jgi:hypothetical protein